MIYDIIITTGCNILIDCPTRIIKKGFKILVIFNNDIFGGIARSNIGINNIPSKHSWRGYASFYKIHLF